MTEEQVREAVKEFFAEICSAREGIAVRLHEDVVAAAIAADNWITSAIPSFVSALPEPFKSDSTTNQKLRLFKVLMKVRFEIG